MTDLETRMNHVIDCEAHTDDQRIMIDFDAEPWFKTATDQEIVALAIADFGNCEEAESVVKHFAEREPAVQSLYEYLSFYPQTPDGTPIGFECHIDSEDANAWIAIHRPHLIATS